MLRCAGLPVTLSSVTNVQLQIVITNGVTDHTLTGTYLTIAAGTYRPNDLLNLIDDCIRRWMVARISALGDTNIGANSTEQKNNKNFNLTITETPGANLALLVCTFNDPQATIGGISATFKSVVLDNSNGLWAKLGMCYPSEANRTFNVSGGIVTCTARFQSKYWFIIDRSELDSGPKKRKHHSSLHRLDSGKGKRFKFGGEHYERDFTFVQQDLAVAGPPTIFGRAYQVSGASRNLLDFRSPNLGGISTGPGNPYFDTTSLFAEGRYIDIGGYVVRAFINSSTQLILSEGLPTSLSITSTYGAPVRLVSELWALYEFQESLGHFYLYESDDLGDIIWVSETYSVYDTDEPELAPVRPDGGIKLYDWAWKLIEIETDLTTLVTVT